MADAAAPESVAQVREDLKQVGENSGVPLFADFAAPPPLELIFVPIQPGIYQAYRTTITRRR